MVKAKAKDFGKLEKVVLNWMAGYRAAGLALRKLKQAKANGDVPFKIYCSVKFDLPVTKAYRLIKAVEVCEQLEKLGFTTMPANEGQANELVQLDDADIKKIWTAVLVGDGRPAMSKIVKAKADLFGSPNDKLPTAKRLLAQFIGAEAIIKKVISDLGMLKVKEAKPVWDRIDQFASTMKLKKAA